MRPPNAITLAVTIFLASTACSNANTVNDARLLNAERDSANWIIVSLVAGRGRTTGGRAFSSMLFETVSNVTRSCGSCDRRFIRTERSFGVPTQKPLGAGTPV